MRSFRIIVFLFGVFPPAVSTSSTTSWGGDSAGGARCWHVCNHPFHARNARPRQRIAQASARPGARTALGWELPGPSSTNEKEGRGRGRLQLI
ncbi:hypothetical protein B0H14DRAFT_2774803 [Mycena olivaceomarginata]|nr:hypothetical protein B0H14DRAFT_2774803 [Mycena olivaceomarginata]